MKNRLQTLYENKKYFEILGIKPTQDLKIINKAFRMTALKYHPEKGGSHDEMVIILDIMQKLRDRNYLQQFFQYSVTGQAFSENFQKIIDNIIRTMNKSIKKVYYEKLNDVLEQAILADPIVDLRESTESPFEVSFHYQHKSSYGEIGITIREELNNGDYREQHFQHTITDVVFIDKVEKTTFFLATSENLHNKITKLIQKINEDTIKRPNKELFDKLNSWLDLQMAELNERAQTAIEPDYGENTRRGMSQKWLNQLAGQKKIKSDSVSNIRQITSGAMLYFFSSTSLPSSSVPSLPQPEYHGEYFEIDYYLLSLLAVTSFTIAVTLLYCLCQPGKTINSDNSYEHSELKINKF